MDGRTVRHVSQVENLWTASTFFVSLTLCTFTKLDHNVGATASGKVVDHV